MSDNNRKQKYNSIFHKTIRNLLTKREIGPKQFTKLVFEALTDESMSDSQRKTCYHTLRSMIIGNRNITYKAFRFIIEEVLKEQIPDDPETVHLKNLGRGRDIRGQTFGRLTVLECTESIDKDKLYWRCLCECGNYIPIRGDHLISGETVSCGCYQRESAAKKMSERITHGMSKSIEYETWSKMLQRCYNQKSHNYNDYGGRGITVCDRWRNSFENFYEDMGDRPEGMSLDRENNDGNYEPGNCRWATDIEQANNRRDTLKFDDGTPVKPWSHENGISYRKVRKLFHAGYSKVEILDER